MERAIASVQKRRKNFPEKYNRFTMENARQLQCKALSELEKSRRRKNNGKQWKKQCAEQSEQSDIRASASRMIAGDAETSAKTNRPPP